MLAFNSNPASSGARAALATSALAMVLAAMAGGGCTLLVGTQLSDKPSEGAGGGGGQGGASSSASQSSSAESSSATGGLVCNQDTANCNGSLVDGCETNLLSDPKNCGACKKACHKDEQCKEGKCE